jgi:hypothetical protein
MRRIVFDSNAIDPLVDNPGAFEALEAAKLAGDLQVLYTHVNIDELAAVPDLERRSTLILLLIALGELVPTGFAACDYSRFNFARFGDEDDAELHETLRSANFKHTRDALIAGTALYEKCALATNEHRLASRARACGIEVLTSRELLAEFGFQYS